MGVGGYECVGKNMNVLTVGDESIILDMGLNMDKVTSHKLNIDSSSTQEMMRAGALPDDSAVKDRSKVKAIILGHAHLDHIGAVPKLASRYKCPIIATPFTLEVLKNISGKHKTYSNKLIPLNQGSSYEISKNFNLEFVTATHSTYQPTISAIHTPEGTVVYANDWKFDNYPVLGKRTNVKRLKQLGGEGVKLFITDTVRVDEEHKTYSETLVEDMFKDVLFWTDNDGKMIFVTCFASNIARLSILIKLANQMGRQPIFVGRSLANYIDAAGKSGVSVFKDKMIASRRNEVSELFRTVKKEGPGNFLAIVTGCQGEPEAVMSRISRGEIKYNFQKEDQVIFSSNVIPTAVNQANRGIVEKALRHQRVRVFRDVHVSGHGAKEDHREMLNMLQPENYVPSHGDIKKLSAAAELGMEEGYELGRNMFLLQDKQVIKL